MKLKKKAELLVSAALLMFALVLAGCDFGLEQSGAWGDFQWRLDGGSITITGYTGAGGAVTIPAEINGRRVTSIGQNAFADSQLTYITIPHGVTSIERSAFWTSRLSKSNITIPSSVISIGTKAFDGSGMTSITIGANVALCSFSFNGIGFEFAYNNGGRLAGTYTRPNTTTHIWIRQ